MKTGRFLLLAMMALAALSMVSCKSDTPWKDEVSEEVSGGNDAGDGEGAGQSSGSGSDNQNGSDSQSGSGQDPLPDTGEITTDNPDETVFTDIDPWTGPMADDKASDVRGTDSDIYWEENSWTNVVTVIYNGNEATVTKTSPDILAYVDGAHVTIDFQTKTLSNVNIIAKGKSSDGSLKIYGAKKSRLALCGLDLTSSKGPAINIQSHKRVFVHMPSGSVNRIADAASYSDDSYYISGASSSTEDRKAAFFSEANLIFSGSGCLVVNGKYKHALCTDGYLYTRPGVTLAATGAAANCFHAKGDDEELFGAKIQGGCLYARASALDGKCLKADMAIIVNGGKFDFQADGQAGKGIKSDADITINAGNFSIKTTGAAYYDSSLSDVSSACCIKSDCNLNILGGNLDLSSTGQAGKGIKAGDDDNAGRNIVIGTESGGPVMNISTSGSAYGNSSSGPGGGRPGGGSSTSGASSKPKAVKATGTITVNGGEISITTTGTEAEGMESKSAVANSIVFNGGNVVVNAYDDGINSAGQIVFAGGNVFVRSTSNDAVDSNYGKTSSILIQGGIVFAHSGSSPEGAFDCDSDSRITISGGTVFSSGGSMGGMGGSSGSPSCTVPALKLSSFSVTAGYFTVTDASSNVVFSTKVPRALSNGLVYVVSPQFKSGSTYKYGMSGTAAPSGSTALWDPYCLTGGTASVSSSFTATSTMTTK